jgi:DNA-binding winged helix-turn-helix (wHTH) protein
MQNLLIYKYNSLYHILEEINFDFNFKINFIDNENFLNKKIINLDNCLILSNKKYFNLSNFIVLNNLPINIFKLVEKINIEFLRLQFSNQSEVKINDYTIDLNSREMIAFNKRVKLTEKEINTIIYLSKTDKPVDSDELQKKVWSYKTDIETHTVETHIYRLRKKFLNTFNDNKFIMSTKNGYQINKKPTI